MKRRHLLGAIAFLPVAHVCEAKSMKVVLDVVLFNYLDRPIFDVYIDGKVGETSEAYPATGGGIFTGVSFALGQKNVTWRLDGPKGTPRNGETVGNRNPLRLDTVVQGAKFLGVHIYPDDNVELTTSTKVPDRTQRGIAMARDGAGGQ